MEWSKGSTVIGPGSCAKTCVAFDAWVGARDIENLGSNVGSGDLPYQSWRNFKEAFAPEIVARAVAESARPVRRVLDPFGGSGTTSLASQFLGAVPVTIEVNPYLADLIEAKLSPYEPEAVSDAFGKIVEGVWERRRSRSATFKGAPSTFVEPGLGGRYVFARSVAERIVAYKRSVDDLESESLRRLFRVLLGSTLIPASNVTVSGKGRRYRQRWQERPKSAQIVDNLFEQFVLRAIYDITRFQDRSCLEYELHRGDARTISSSVGEIDLVVCSPPYPNSFDYTDVYNLELWALGYLESSSENTALRKSTLRSHVQIKRDMSISFAVPKALSDAIHGLRSENAKLWNPYIPDMIGAYFQDMYIILKALYSNLLSHGRAYFVVGDSQYSGVIVPVAQILSHISESIGFHLVSKERFRSMRSSPQQGGRRQLSETLLILEKPS